MVERIDIAVVLDFEVFIEAAVALALRVTDREELKRRTQWLTYRFRILRRRRRMKYHGIPMSSGSATTQPIFRSSAPEPYGVRVAHNQAYKGAIVVVSSPPALKEVGIQIPKVFPAVSGPVRTRTHSSKDQNSIEVRLTGLPVVSGMTLKQYDFSR